ncbi:hypothetical protein ESCO_002574 [Escovopsis weberi]|uniref:Uncharacterized protein n=1 Tax=Escovopsis weberi TaxID=150374 RepID=A0A0M9VT15_ESCWE|nr:hypothetical protein ESCO_002574 [Escovopsis weberi]
MSRNRMATELQKTYDDSYLSCSTAVFYEGQGNEAEATRYWKNALDRICDYHKTQPFPATRGDQAQVDQSLFRAIKELEYQCRERIDILEALRVSRQYDPGNFPGIQPMNTTEGDSVAGVKPGFPFPKHYSEAWEVIETFQS